MKRRGYVQPADNSAARAQVAGSGDVARGAASLDEALGGPRRGLGSRSTAAFILPLKY